MYGENNYGPHAVTTVWNHPSYTPLDQSITYTDFDKVAVITDTLSDGSTRRIEFTYGFDRQRRKSVFTEGTSTVTKYFFGDYEEVDDGVSVKKYFYISSPTGLAAVYVSGDSGSDTLHYIFTDHLGSVTEVVNGTTGAVTRQSFDAWGNPRSAADWRNTSSKALFAGRGFTGHEHLEAFALINMNGRMYDPALGRFLSPDPYVQTPDFSQSFNRYSYCLNNPLKYTDPSGEIIFTVLSLIYCPVLLPIAIHADYGWISGGISSMKNGGTFFDGAILGGTVGAINGAFSMTSPLKIPFGESGFGISISPQISEGTDGLGLGVNTQIGYDLGQGFNVGVNVGGSYYTSATGTGSGGFEGRLGYGIGYNGKHLQLGLGSTYFMSGETTQLTGQFYLGGGKWRMTYENDTWAPVPGLWDISGANSDRDQYRTVAMKFDINGGKYRGFNCGFFIFTGSPNNGINRNQGPNGTFIDPDANKYRLGAAYAGYGNIRVGYNSEKNIRGPIQNGFHDLNNYPRFEVLDISNRFYGGYYSSNPYTLW